MTCRNMFFFCSEATRGGPKSPAGDIVDVGTPFYQDGLLRVHVYWQSSSGKSPWTVSQLNKCDLSNK